jgi:hypothetical protein
MKKISLFVMLLTLILGFANAKEKKETKESIIEKHLNAKFQNLNKDSIKVFLKNYRCDLTMLDNEGTQIDVSTLYEIPGKFRIEAIIDSIPSILGTDGQDFWGKIPPYKFVQNLPQTALEESYVKFIKPVTEFDDFLRILQDSNYSIKLLNKEKTDNSEIYSFKANKDKEPEYLIFIDSKDFLISKISGTRKIKNNDVKFTYEFSDYKSVKLENSDKSVMKPYKIIYSYTAQGKKSVFTINIKNVQINSTYSEKAFAIPSK